MSNPAETVQKARDTAVKLFQAYFKKAFQASGLEWNAVDDAKIAGAVDLVITAATLDALDR